MKNRYTIPIGTMPKRNIAISQNSRFICGFLLNF